MGDEMLHYLRKTGFILMGMSLLVALPLFAASVETLLKEAREKAYSKDYTAAIIIYDAILKKYPSNLEAKNGKARVLSWAGKYDEAEKIYQEVLSGYPENIEAQTGLVDIYAWQKQYAKATEFLEDILSRDRKNRDVLVKLARFHMWAGEKKQSIFYCNLILKIYPGDRDAKLIKRQAQEIYTFEFYTGYNYLKISDNPTGYNLYAGIRYLPKTKITLYGQIDYLDKYNEIDGRGLLGGSYQISNKYILSSEMGISPDAEIYPRVFGWIELSSPVFPSAAISARVFGSQYKVVDAYGISFAGEYYTFAKPVCSLKTQLALFDRDRYLSVMHIMQSQLCKLTLTLLLRCPAVKQFAQQLHGQANRFISLNCRRCRHPILPRTKRMMELIYIVERMGVGVKVENCFFIQEWEEG